MPMAPSVSIEFIGQRELKKSLPLSVDGVRLMGKGQKVSKGYSSGFIPDYGHAVETVAESEGFGYSGHVETKIIALDNNSGPKRKDISFDMDCFDQFSVPVQILSLSKMSQPDRKCLEIRLKKELDQVRDLQKKIAFMNSSVVVLSPTSDIHDYSDAQQRHVSDGLHRSVSLGKNWGPLGGNASHTKQPTLMEKFDSTKQGQLPSSSHALLTKQCKALLNRLMSHQHGWVFNTPVDVVKLNIPDYYIVIKHPMDLGTVKTKLTSGVYTSPSEFAADVRLTFSNAMTYNPPGNDVHIMAGVLNKYFEMRWKPIEKKLYAPMLSKSTIHTKIENTNPMPQTKKKKITTVENEVRQEPVRVMTNADKQKLSMDLEALLAELPESIIDFLKEKSSNGNQTTEDEIEIDIDTLGDDNLFTLRKHLDNYMADKKRNKTKAEALETELHKESIFSNSDVQPCKGNDLVDEDIDIGGADMPISGFPPVEIEKDMAAKNSKCNTSSSSSNEAGSSSSETDSGSSSGSESDGAKASVPTDPGKEILGSTSGENLEIKKNVIGNTDIRNEPIKDLNLAGLESQSKPVSVVTDGLQKGESSHPERQVSPEKLYRAALLRSRFADTILKAQETTLGKGGMQDPERLRLEKEELERRIKEEKARLEAEAKAAEEARRKADADAAAESKRKRDLEREAARQALQKMEKTVDINGNSQFLEDLEMLRVAPTEQLESFVDEKTSPELCLDGLGSFKFEGNTNPLEQLGLYMKDNDDDDEEEAEQECVPPVVDETEDGEID